MSTRPLLASSAFAPNIGHIGTRRKLSPSAGSPSRSNGTNTGIPFRKDPSNGNNHRVRFVIADDQSLYRRGLRKLVESQPGLSVVGETSVSSDVVKLVRERKADILLLDLGWPGNSGLQVLSDLAGLTSPVRTLVLVATIEEGLIVEALFLGAQGVVLKASPAAGTAEEYSQRDRGSILAGRGQSPHGY